jgi:hypothetical protein
LRISNHFQRRTISTLCSKATFISDTLFYAAIALAWAMGISHVPEITASDATLDSDLGVCRFILTGAEIFRALLADPLGCRLCPFEIACTWAGYRGRFFVRRP